jgi:hypothetical protein
MAFFLIEPITACALTLACLGAPAQPAGSTFELRMQTVDGRANSVSLQCQPAGGTHPHGAHACAELAAVNGDFENIRSNPEACTLNYQPVDVFVEGHWRGKPKTFSASYGNPCLASVSSNGIFDF